MTIPMWMPFALLTAVCAIRPIPGWVRRVDWIFVGAWTAALSFCVAVWWGVFLLIGWYA